MTVAELIAKLQEMPQDAKVWINRDDAFVDQTARLKDWCIYGGSPICVYRLPKES